MNEYLLGCDVLGAAAAQPQSTISVTTIPQFPVPDSGPHTDAAPVLTPASAPELFYGPSIGPGMVYTDKPTIRAVQKKLASLGYFNGTVDGKFGPQTEAALFNFSGKHGPPDDATLDKLQKAVTKLRPWPAWKIGAVAGGSAVGAGLLIWVVSLLRRR